MNTSPATASKIGIAIALALMLASHAVFGLGADHPAGRPVHAQGGWPSGLVDLVNATNRVHGYFVNAEDIFFFSGNAAELNTFLRECSQLTNVVVRRFFVHPGTGEAKSPWGKESKPCDWKLYVCPKGWYNAGQLPRQGTNSLETLRKAASEPGYVLDVHFWTGGKIPLDQVTIPKNMEITKD